MIEVSVIIPFFGDPQPLRTTLQAIAAQTYPAGATEIVVVDNASGADLSPLRSEFPQVRWLEEARPSSYAARNRGVAGSSGRILAFTDADCVPDSTWLAEGIRALAELKAGVVGGPVEYFDPPDRPLNVYELIEERYFLLSRQRYLIEKLNVAATANLFTTREVFARVGPFDASLKSFGDGDWTKRAVARGEVLRYAAKVLVRHPRRSTFEEISRKLVRVAGGRMALMRKNRAPFPAFLSNILAYSLLDPRIHFAPLTFRRASAGQKVKLFFILELLSVRIVAAKLRAVVGGRTERS